MYCIRIIQLNHSHLVSLLLALASYTSRIMLFKTLSLHLMLFGSCLTAARTKGRQKDLALLSTEETDFGMITIWGASVDASGQSATGRDFRNQHLPLHGREAEGDQQHQRRCGTNMVICGGPGLAPNPDTCSKLIDFLVFFPKSQLGTEPQSLCLLVNGGQCCVSWASPVGGLLTGDLVPGANSTYENCAKMSPTRSGLVRDINLNGECTTICLYDRPDGWCPNE